MKRNKFDELKCIINSFNETIHIIVLSETWIKSEDQGKSLQIPCYTHYYNFRQNSRGGGVSIFVHNNLKHNLIDQKAEEDNHYLWIHISKFSLNIGAVYKPERTNLKNFIETYSAQIQRMKRSVVFGDFNVNLLISDNSTRKYKNIYKENGYRIINKIDPQYCTRETETTRTILDHVCSNLKDHSFHLAIVDSAMSDHKHIYFEIQSYQPPTPKKISYTALDYNKLYKHFQRAQETQSDISYERLIHNLTFSIKQSQTTKTKVLNPPRKDWINKEIIKGLENRNKLWRDYKKDTSNKEIEQNFRKQKNEMTELIQKTKNTYYHKCFESTAKKPRKMWELINDLSKNKIKDFSGPDKLIADSGEITDKQEICEEFNSYFSSIGTTLANEIPSRYHIHRTLRPTPSSTQSPELHEITPVNTDEIVKIIDSLDPNTSCGIDGISTKAIKCVKSLIVDDLTKCINHCFEIGTFPDNLKIAKVSPIYKSGTKSDPSNYRPISVLPTLSKIFEKILHSRLETFLNSINFFYKNQYGFRRKSNTLAATIDFVTKIKNKLDQKQVALGVFVDLKKAFDTVSHHLLLEKLFAIGIKGKVFKLLESYLQNRQQMVKISENQSSAKLITCGVPQGSILGPLLFLVYINDIYQIDLQGDVTLYADDTSIIYYGHSVEVILPQAQCDLNKLDEWFKYNLLTVNTNKTNYVIFHSKNKKLKDNTQLRINNQPIQKKYKEKYLGIILDNQLNWKPHIEKIHSKLVSLTGALHGIAKCFPKQVRYLIYNSLVKPHLDYLIEIWGTAAQSNLKVIQTMQNKLIKILFNYHYRTSTEKLYKETGIMNIRQTYVYNTCILIHKILNDDINTNINLIRKSKVQRIRLRNANNIVPRQHRTNYGKKNIEYEGVLLYNKLPDYVKFSQSMASFKRKLKHFVLDQVHNI